MGNHTKPVEFIAIIHKYLYKICKESGLEGLAYRGAPEVKCTDCGEELHCVEYDNGEEETFITPEYECEVECTTCMTKCDVNRLMVNDYSVLYSDCYVIFLVASFQS